MFIRNNSFSDEDTLLETIFDFGLGNHTPVFKEIFTSIEQDMEASEELKQQILQMETEDAEELVEDIRLDQLCKRLLAKYDSFEVYSACFYGIKDGAKEKLSEVELV